MKLLDLLDIYNTRFVQVVDNSDTFLGCTPQEWYGTLIIHMEANNNCVDFSLNLKIISNSESILQDRIVNYLESRRFDQSVTATLNDALNERMILQVANSQSDVQKHIEQKYHLKHVSIYNFKLEHLSNKREVYSPGNFYTKKREKQTIRISISIWILTVDDFLHNNRKVIHIKDSRGWFLHLKRRRHLFRPLHKKKQIFSLKQKKNTTQDVYAPDEKICQPSFTYVYCVSCLSIIDEGNRILQMEGNSR